MARPLLARVVFFWITLALAVTATALAREATEERAHRAATLMIERALACEESDIVPLSALVGARPGETVFVHDVDALEPLYGLVALTSSDGHMLGVAAVKPNSDKCLWSSFKGSADRLLPVTAAGARHKLVAAGQLAGSNEIGEPRYATLKGIMAAAKKQVTNWSSADVPAVAAKNKMLKLFVPVHEATCEFIEGETPEEAGAALAAKLREVKLV